MIKKCRCKGTMSVCQSMSDGDWEDVFIKDKWYEVNHVEWSNDPVHDLKMRKINGGWRDYLAMTEFGTWRQLTRSDFNIIFYSDVELREALINDIIENIEPFHH